MIKINLLGDVRTVDHTTTLMIGGYIASIILLFVVSFYLYSSASAMVEDLSKETELLEAQLKNLKEKTKSVAELEKKKQDLNDKLKVIAVLKRSKSGPVRTLDDLNGSIPEKSWIAGLEESENTLKISGFALDNQTIAVFMKDLAKSDFFETVDLVETKVATREGVKLKSFILSAKINYAGKVKAAPAATPGTAGGGK